MTIAMVMKNTVTAARARRAGLLHTAQTELDSACFIIGRRLGARAVVVFCKEEGLG